VNHGAAVSQENARDLVALLKGFGDRHHQGKEEAVLFPALLRDPQQEHYAKLCSLIFEHDQERSLIDGLEEAVETRNTKEFLFCANRIVEATRAHIHGEDTCLLNLIDSVLSPVDDERVATELREFEHSWQSEVLPNLLKRLDELELEYCRTASPESAAAC
jgi:hemerythrin-like domain-containing protein